MNNYYELLKQWIGKEEFERRYGKPIPLKELIKRLRSQR